MVLWIVSTGDFPKDIEPESQLELVCTVDVTVFLPGFHDGFGEGGSSLWAFRWSLVESGGLAVF